MIAGITLFYAAVIYFLKDSGDIERFTTLLIVSDPSMLGFIFIGLSMILEKDQEVFSVLFITPMNHHYYLISRVLVLSLLTLICSLGMVLMAKGASFNLIHFSVGVISTCILFSFVGIYLVSYTNEILHYILRSIPVIAIMSLPIMNYFELTDWTILKLFPMQGSLSLIANSYRGSPNITELVIGYISLAIWIPFLYWFVYKTFKSRLVNT